MILGTLQNQVPQTIGHRFVNIAEKRLEESEIDYLSPFRCQSTEHTDQKRRKFLLHEIFTPNTEQARYHNMIIDSLI